MRSDPCEFYVTLRQTGLKFTGGIERRAFAMRSNGGGRISNLGADSIFTSKTRSFWNAPRFQQLENAVGGRLAGSPEMQLLSWAESLAIEHREH
jgi:hypothetical protein